MVKINFLKVAQKLKRDWNDFFFGCASPKKVSIFRGLFSAFLFHYFIFRQSNFFLFYGPGGIVESGLARPPLHASQLSLFLFLWPHTGVWCLPFYVATLIFIFAFGVGFATRLSALAVWAMTLTWINPMVLGNNASDSMVRILSFLNFIASLSGAYDRKNDRQIEIWPFRLMQIQLVAIYFYSANYKLMFPEWRDGSAMYLILGDELLSRYDFSALANYPKLGWTMTFAVLAFELFIFPIFVWVKSIRLLVLSLGLALHFFISMTMKIDGFLPVLGMFYLSFLVENHEGGLCFKKTYLRASGS